MALHDLLIRILARNEAKSELNEVKAFLGGLGSLAAKVGLTLSAAFSVRELAQFSADAIRIAADAEAIARSFENLTRSAGVSAKALQAELERVAGGVATNAQLMQVANMALQGGTRELVQSLPQLFEVARAAAVASGQDVIYVYDTLVRGIIRGSPLLIDNANIFVKVGDAMERYAASVGKTVEELSAQERQVALLNAVLADSSRIIQATGVDANSAAAQLQSMTAAVQELKQAWGETLIAMGAGEAVGGLAQFARTLAENARAIGEFDRMAQDFARAGMRDLAEQAQFAAQAVRRYGAAYVETLPRTRELRAAHEVLVKTTRDLAVNTQQAARAMSNAVLPTTQWGDALAYLNRQAMAAAESAAGVFDWTKSTRADRYREGLERRRELWDSWLREERERQAREAEWRALEAQRGADAYTAAWERAFADMRSMAERALQARVQPTELDFLLTSLGQYENAPLEAVRRIDAILARGFAELQAHPDWAALLKIPEDVLAGGETALRAWALRTREAVASLARPDLIDWDAFVAEFRRLQEMEAARETTLDIALQKLAEAGLVSGATKAAARAQVAEMLGLDTPELLGAQLATGFDQAFGAADPAGKLLAQMQRRFEQQKQAYIGLGRQAGTWLGDSIHEAALAELDNFLPDLARRLSPYLTLPGGSPLP